jgi:hypothetical protein
VHNQNQLTESHFPWLPAKSPLIHSSWPKPRQIARPRAPCLKRRSVVHNPLSLVRARSLALFSLSRALSLSPWRQEVNSCSHYGSSGTFWASSLVVVFRWAACLFTPTCCLSRGRKRPSQLCGKENLWHSNPWRLHTRLQQGVFFFQFFNIQTLANVFQEVSKIRRFI